MNNKKMIKYLFLFRITLLILILLFPVFLFSQEMKTPDFEFKYFKDTDNNRILQTRTSYYDGIKEHILTGLNINFYTKEKDLIKLGNVSSDSKGLARYILPSEIKLPVDVDGNWYFMAEFEGDSIYDADSEEILIQDIDLEMTLSESENVKTVSLKASKMIGDEVVPVSGEDIVITVPRMFSQLPVGEGYFDDNGTAEIEFPSDIPGDDNGIITIVAKFEDHDVFGNVEKRQQIAWGTPGIHESGLQRRELWTQVAPKWMIFTLSIMLVGVWGHYIFAIISLVRIKRSAEK